MGTVSTHRDRARFRIIDIVIAMTIDGILRQPNTGGTIGVGTLLYRALVENTGVALIDDADKPGEVDHWLAVNRLDEHSYIIRKRGTDPEDAGERRAEQVLRLKAIGPVEALLDPSPAVVETVITNGTPAFLYINPAYSQPDFLPGNKHIPTAWSSLIAEVDRLQDVKARDARLAEELN